MPRTAARGLFAAAAWGWALLAGPTQAAPADTGAALEMETSDVLSITPPKPTWFFVDGGWDMPGTSIFDGETGKMKGMVETRRLANFAIDPAGKYYYVSETIWSKGDRGTRQDMVSVYDSQTLNLITEVPLPGRILIGARKNNFIVSDDGKTAYVYDFSPVSGVNIVDLVKRKFVTAVELPGCASMMPNPGVGFSALCSDGSLATVAIKGTKANITHSAPFFSAKAASASISASPWRNAFGRSSMRRTGSRLSASTTIGADYSVIPHVLSIGAAYRNATNGGAATANGDNAWTVQAVYDLYQNVALHANYSKMSGSAHTATSQNNLTTLMLEMAW